MRVLAWRKSLALAVALLIAVSVGHFLFVMAMRSMNEHISRCMDQSAPQYIFDSDQRRRECGSE
ncbi:hypothetical protein [Bosea sp. (in: a-proteobacteria)]|uniref:hypothetical protein n=1 Tax=Bosea sp. (in: a-proteobacteria) TaxID=1871050 RepID=UPI003B3A0ECB